MIRSYKISLPAFQLQVFVILLLSQYVVNGSMAQENASRSIIVKELSLRQSINNIIKDDDGFLWVATDEGLYRYDGYNFESVGGESMPEPDLRSTYINTLLEDDNGYLWIGTKDNIRVFSPDRNHVWTYTKSSTGSGSITNVNSILKVGKELWALDFSSFISCFVLPKDTSDQLVLKRQIEIPGVSIRSCIQLSDGNLIVGTASTRFYVLSPKGDIIRQWEAPFENALMYPDTINDQLYAMVSPDLYNVDPYTGKFELEVSFLSIFLKPNPCWLLSATRNNQHGIWIGNKLGHLLWYSPETKRYEDFTELLSTRLYEGRFFSSLCGLYGNGSLWLGTNLGLAHVRIPDLQHFQALPLPKSAARLTSYSTRGILQADDGSMFVGGYSGMFRYYPDGRIEEYRVWNNELKTTVNPLAYDFLQEGSNLWIASEGNGLLRFDMTTNSLQRVLPESFYDSLLATDRKTTLWCFRIFKDHKGVKWLGTFEGLYVVDQHFPQRVKRVTPLGAEMGRIMDIREDQNGTLWIASVTGLYSISGERIAVKKYDIHIKDGTTVNCLYIQDNDMIWIGTRGEGLRKYDLRSHEVTSYSTFQGLANDVVCAIQPSDEGILWISTDNGLSRFDPQQKSFRNFYIEDGLPDNEFNHGSSMKTANGTIYFGGVSGVVYFNAEKGKFTSATDTLRVSKIGFHDGKQGITRYQLFNRHLRPEIKLRPLDKYFTVFYSKNDAVSDLRQSFTYMLEGFHDDWQINDNKNYIQFTGLRPGHYKLRIRTLTQLIDEETPILEIPVYIQRPFYTEWWAYVSYILILAGISFIILRVYFQRLHIHRRLQLEMDHKTKLQEINRSKSTFFTNITHEFKTPLTLIQGPAEEIARVSQDPQVVKHAGLISKNAKAILALVNQLLDLGKLEANLEEPQYHRLDMVHLLRQWLEKFYPLALQKDIKLGFETDQPSIYADFDPVKIETVINNLLSNAIKFTPEKGIVKCSVHTLEDSSGMAVYIIVEDSGPGIDPSEQDLVFERFYQGKNSVLGGTGIGLAFVREMVRIHSGTVVLDSSPGKGAKFTVRLPMYQTSTITSTTLADDKTADGVKKTLDSADSQPEGQDAQIILIAEDNEDVAHMISDMFKGQFRVVMASNGKEAHMKALEIIPDIVITDVMMPVMDGYSLTYLLKQDFHTSHIPVIMLTAKDGEVSRIEGRTHGADIYLQKPFSVQELKLTVRNLLNLRSQIIQNVSKQAEEDVRSVNFSNDADSTFYRNFLQVLEENLSESTLSVENFTVKLGISRTQLHRKLKAITGLSVNQVIRNMRLQKSLSLLRHSGKSISEIAYEVGFTSPSYFTERFKEYYGYPPSEIENRQSSPTS